MSVKFYYVALTVAIVSLAILGILPHIGRTSHELVPVKTTVVEPVATDPVVAEPAEPVKPVTLSCEVVEVCKPAEPVVKEPAEPVVKEPAEPVVKEPAEPVVEEPTEPVAEEPTEPELPYTEEELDALALVIYQEAGADFCSDDTRLKVGSVVLNRVADERFPNTIEEVLTQKAQYGRLYWTGLVWPERASTEAEAHAVKRAYDCAERILMGERFLPEDVVWQAEFTQGIEIVCQQEGFYFCR